MKNLKIILLILTISAIGTAAFFAFTSRTSYKLDQAAEMLKANNLSTSLSIIENLKTDLPPSQLHLYQSYLSRSEGLIELSKQQLEKAFKAYQKELKMSQGKLADGSALLREIQCNRAFNSIAELKLEDISQHVQELSDQQDFFSSYFLGLDHFYHDQFQEALTIWENLPQRSSESKWLNIAFDQLVPPSKIIYQILQCHIELGHASYLQELLEETTRYQDVLLPEEISYLKGLAFAKLGQEAHSDHRLEYYRQADLQFSASGKDRSVEKTRLKQIYRAMLLDLLENNHLQLFGALIEKIEMLNTGEVPSDILIKCLQRLSERSEDYAVEFQNQLPHHARLRKLISGHFEKELQESIESERLAQARSLWTRSTKWTSDLDNLVAITSSLCQKKILENIEVDDDALTRTLPYILLWKEIEGTTAHPTLISQQLVYLSGTLWITHAQPMKGLKLMQVAKELCDFHDRQSIHNAIAHELKVATAFAKHYSFFDLLCLIHNAIEHFHITTVELGSPGEAANQIADAHFLFNQKRYEEAARRLKWALCLDPTNVAALRLLGLAHFQQGKYAQAVESLQKLPANDFQMTEIIGICLIQSDKTSQGQDLLKCICHVHPLSDDSLYLLGSREEQPEWAIHWLAAIKHPNPEVLARLFISYHTMQNWHSAIEVYHQLSPPYSKLYALQRMAVDCFIALNKKDFAEELLEAMQMEEPTEPSSPGFAHLSGQNFGKLRDPISSSQEDEMSNSPQEQLS